jgi:membrane protein
MAGLFALMFKFFPDAKIKWRHVWVGSLVTAFLFDIGKFALGFYFGKANPGMGYGAAGSVILIMLWVSYSSMIVFYGAEFTHAYAGIYSGKAPPSRRN